MNVQTPLIGAAGKAEPLIQPSISAVDLAVADLREGLKQWELWGTLGWHDIRQRYRRSTIGPFWITISMGIMVVGLSVLWSTIFRQSVASYLPYFALGFIVWTLISSLVQEGCTVFYSSEGIIKQLPVPLSIHMYRLVWRNLIIAAHNMCIYVIVAVVFGIWPGFGLIAAALGFVFLAINGVSAGLIVGILSARFRDIPPTVASLLQMIFFFSPILWMPESLPERHYLVHYNPFYYFIEIVRAPLLGQTPELSTWFVVTAITALTCMLAFALFVRFRHRVAYWV